MWRTGHDGIVGWAPTMRVATLPSLSPNYAASFVRPRRKICLLPAKRLRFCTEWRLLFITSVLFSSCGSAGRVYAQASEDPGDRLDRLIENVDRVSLRISVDRPDRKYFVGEVGTVTYSMTNGTSEALEIPDPTDDLAGGTHMNDHSARCTATDLSDEQFQKCRPYLLHASARPDLNVRSRVIQPGETVTTTVRTTDPVVPGTSVTKVTGGGSFATTENSWELIHDLGGSLIIQTVAPILERSAWAQLNAMSEGLPKQIPVFSVLYGGEHIVCISESFSLTTEKPIEVDSNHKFTWQGADRVAPFHRVATVPRAVEALTATADGQDWITIQADLGQGLIYRFVLDGNRNLVQTNIQNP